MALETHAIRTWLDVRLRLDATLQALMGQRWYAGIAEEQEPGAFSVRLLGMPTGGTFRLVLGGEQTAAIAYNASAATVRTALENLPTPVPGDILVEGYAGGPWTVSLIGLMGSSVSQLSATSSLTGGSQPSVEVRDTAPIFPYGSYHVQSAVDRIGNNAGRIFVDALVAVKVYAERGGYLQLGPILKRVDALLTNTVPASVTVLGDSYTVRGSHRTRVLEPEPPPAEGIVYRVAMPLYRVIVHAT
jgi:hypothetical protein